MREIKFGEIVLWLVNKSNGAYISVGDRARYICNLTDVSDARALQEWATDVVASLEREAKARIEALNAEPAHKHSARLYCVLNNLDPDELLTTVSLEKLPVVIPRWQAMSYDIQRLENIARSVSP